MKFRIIGADRRTGRDVTREYEANTPQDATAAANRDGIMVAGTELVSGAMASVPQSLESLAYRTPTTPSDPVPTYAGLAIAGGALRIYAIVCYVLGGLALVGAAVGLMMDVGNGRSFSFSLLVNVMGMLTPALLLLFAAAITHGLSAACVALCDIARNSWR